MFLGYDPLQHGRYAYSAPFGHASIKTPCRYGDTD